MPPGPRAFPTPRPGRRAPRPPRHGEPSGHGVAPAPPEETSECCSEPGLSLCILPYLTQEERAVRDRNLLQVQDHDQPIPWKVQFHLGNSSRPGNQCRNSIQGKHLITDELGYICERKDLLVNGCCNVNVPGTKQYRCDGCLPHGCCGAYEYCVSCCLQPSKQLLLERFLNRAAVAFQNLFMAVEDHFELCLAKCRTSSQVSACLCLCITAPSALRFCGRAVVGALDARSPAVCGVRARFWLLLVVSTRLHWLRLR
ncbi:SREBP regulating gene protein isoform X2 [Mirounga angustirostris]|uniref:SREBP regulating gene protein isoform X2 n=1 Tax=Mirounga angustirostris TaxID=9716 RepID=UPI00313B403D